MIRSVLTSGSLLYVFLRYITYALTFINTLLLAKFLGGFEYGIYSFILLVMNYMSYSNLGINESLNTEYAKFKHKKISKKIWNTAWSINLIISILGCLIFLSTLVFHKTIFSEYNFGKYAVVVILTCLIINLERVYITFYKIFGKLLKLNIQQILPNLVLIILILYYRSDINISIIVWSLFITNFISLIIFRLGLSIQPQLKISFRLAKRLITRGISLLMYNFSFYFLILLASSIVSIEYSVTDFGCFSLSNSIANGVIMAGGAFLFIFYPKILNAMNQPKEKCINTINRIKSIYVIGIDIITVLSIPAVFGISLFFPQYSLSLVRIYSILMIGKCINNATTGYSAYLIANKKENTMTIYAIMSAIIEWIIIRCFTYYGLPMEFVGLGVVMGSMIYTTLIVVSGVKALYGCVNFEQIFKELFGNGNWMVFCILIVFSFLWTNIYFMVVAFLCYYSFNGENINNVVRNGLNIISNKNALNF